MTALPDEDPHSLATVTELLATAEAKQTFVGWQKAMATCGQAIDQAEHTHRTIAPASQATLSREVSSFRCRRFPYHRLRLSSSLRAHLGPFSFLLSFHNHSSA